MQYRAEIDGLRAIAVLPVILFHAGFSLFSGGFVGVDVFFVISGYLITTIIVSQQQGGKFSLVQFYERRARRILPALFLVMAVSAMLAWYTLTPVYMADFSRSLVAVAAFGSNFLFWQESGYFGTENELKPLLHTWSLAVEEQYYVLFPLMLMAMWSLRKRAFFSVLVTLAIVSLLLSEMGAREQSAASFFLLHSRAWELALGALIALYFIYGKGLEGSPRAGSWLAEVLAACGLAMIAFAVLVYDSDTPFPGLAALVPTLGAGLVIVFASNRTLIGQFLGHKTIVGVGLISYSAYLWHQPLFAFSRHYNDRENSTVEYLGLVVLTLLLAGLTWKFVEQPWRNRNGFSRKTVLVCAVAGSLFFVGAGLAGHFSKGFPGRYSTMELRVLEFLDYYLEDSYRYRKCFMDQMQGHEDFVEDCTAGDEIMIWGDSHAAALFYGFNERRDGTTQYAASGCPPLLGYESGVRPQCPALVKYVLHKVATIQPEVLLLLADWDDPLGEYQAPFQELLSDTVAAIATASPDTRIVLLGGLPKWRPALPVLIQKKKVELESGAYVESVFLADIASYDAILEETARRHQLSFLSLVDLYCREGKCLSAAGFEGRYEPFAWDYGHLTKTSSMLVAKDILEYLENSSNANR